MNIIKALIMVIGLFAMSGAGELQSSAVIPVPAPDSTKLTIERLRFLADSLSNPAAYRLVVKGELDKRLEHLESRTYSIMDQRFENEEHKRAQEIVDFQQRDNAWLWALSGINTIAIIVLIGMVYK